MNVRMIWVVLGVLALGGCATQQPDHGHTGTSTAARTAVGHHGGDRGSMMEHGAMGSMCPAHVAGTTTRVEHVPGGAALDFTTTGDVTELRRRVAQMADMHNRHHASDAQGAPTHEGSSQRRGMQEGTKMIPAAQAKVEEIHGGARIVFVPSDAGQLNALREHVGMMAERMPDEGCSMMMEH